MIQTGIQLGLNGQNLDYYFVHWYGNWNLFRKIMLITGFLYDNGKETGQFGETFARYGLDISLRRPLTQKLSASLGYRFFLKDAVPTDFSYTVNSILLGLDYRF